MVKDIAQDKISPFSIWTRAYERELNNYNGFELKAVENMGEIPGGVRDWNGCDVRYGESSNQSLVHKVLKKYRDVPGFSCMRVKDSDEIFEHIGVIYGLMHSHYILGKVEDFDFPDSECAPSAQNLMVASMIAGYPNAATLYDGVDDHCYVGFPFLLEDEKGLIIADPTSDQLWKKRNPRNHIAVVKHEDWSYNADDWRGGNDLYPDRFVNLDSFKKSSYAWNTYNEDMDGFFDSVFKNAVKVELGDIVDEEASCSSRA